MSTPSPSWLHNQKKSELVALAEKVGLQELALPLMIRYYASVTDSFIVSKASERLNWNMRSTNICAQTNPVYLRIPISMPLSRAPQRHHHLSKKKTQLPSSRKRTQRNPVSEDKLKPKRRLSLCKFNSKSPLTCYSTYRPSPQPTY